MIPLSLFVLGALLLAEGGLGEKGAFERILEILEINLGKGKVRFNDLFSDIKSGFRSMK